MTQRTEPHACNSSGMVGRKNEPGDATNVPGSGSNPMEVRTMLDRIRYARLVVRVWLWLSRWTERRLCEAYNRLVDAESPEA